MTDKHTYRAFDDARAQVRLLKVASTAAQVPSFETSIWYLDEAPPYIAISYTWGAMKTEPIVLDDTSIYVRHNARYALTQVLHHWPSAYVWIDSICINQEDNEEKSMQVAMMYEIYQNAGQMAVSLGSHADDSDWLVAILISLEPLYHGLGSQHQVDYRHISSSPERSAMVRDMLWTHLLRALPVDLVDRFLVAMIRFATRPYWQRLWIVQEMAAARRQVHIMCGSDTVVGGVLIMWCHILRIHKITRSRWRMHRSDAPLPMIKALMCQLREKEKLEDLIGFYNDMLCTDKRDRLFALLSLTNWETSRLPRTRPDYSKSTWELAVLLASNLSFMDIHNLLDAFEIDMNSEELLAIVKRQRLPPLNSSVMPLDSGIITLRAGSGIRAIVICARLSGLSPWNLDMPLSTDSSESHDPILRALGPLQCGKHAKIWKYRGRLTALICPKARNGDVIIPVDGLWTGLLLVVRKTPDRDTYYDIVGQGVMLETETWYWVVRDDDLPIPVCHCSSATKECHSLFHAEATIRLTAEEAIVLVGQDSCSRMKYSRERFDPEARLRRLATAPASDAIGAVRILNESCYLTSSEEAWEERQKLRDQELSEFLERA